MVSSGFLRRVALVRNNPENTILHSHRRENLKSYKVPPYSEGQQQLLQACTRGLNT
jgi:hypothetical protein